MGTMIGYSMIVHAGALEEDPGAPIAARMEGLSPPDAAPGLAAEPNMRLVDLSCDFLVAGGGMAGVCAAIAAARHGAKVVLAQDRSRLGGNASSEIRMHIVGADAHGGRKGWREGGILEELRLEDAVRNPHWSWELWDLLLYDKVVSEPNITLLLDSVLYAVEMDGERIGRALIRSDKTECIHRVTSPLYADCTGDCRLGLEAGAAMRTGREGRDAFDESLAPPQGDEETLGSSILFTARDYGKPIPFTPPAWARKFTKDQLDHRPTGSWEYGYWWIEWGGRRDLVHDNERIRFELLRVVMGVWDYIKNSGEHPDSAHWGMEWLGMIPGKRSSRRLDGPHVLTQHDLVAGGSFEDAVAIGGWPIDIHPPTGIDDPDQPPFTPTQLEHPYNIPLRCLYSVNVPNLFMAGRNISASHVAFASTRVMATCSVEGQAIGTAAAQCARDGIVPGEMSADPGRVRDLRQALLRDDQTILGVGNEDPRDLARAATATASSSLPDSWPQSVTDGYTRDLPGDWRHRWGASLAEGPAWIELAWDSPRLVAEVQLVFDTGFSRGQLTLSASHHHQSTQIRGPQPETVRDYTIECRGPSGEWKTVAEVRGNYQRLRRHRFEAVEAAAVRVTVTGSHGGKEARIYEVRCYA